MKCNIDFVTWWWLFAPYLQVHKAIIFIQQTEYMPINLRIYGP